MPARSRKKPDHALVRDLLGRLKAAGADPEIPAELKDYRLVRSRKVPLGLLDELATLLTGMLPRPKGRRSEVGRPLAEMARRVASFVGKDFDINEALAVAAKHWRLDEKDTQSLRILVNKILREQHKVVDLGERRIDDLKRRFHLGPHPQSGFVPPDDDEK